MTSFSLIAHEPARVLILYPCEIGHVLQCHGGHLRLIKGAMDPGSNSTLSRMHDLMAEMVYTTIILVGVSHLVLGILTSSGTVTTNFKVTAYLKLASAESQILVTLKLHTVTSKLLVIL